MCVCVYVCKCREKAKDSSGANLFVPYEVMVSQVNDYASVVPWIKSA